MIAGRFAERSTLAIRPLLKAPPMTTTTAIKIGKHTLSNRVVLAPMAGVSDAPFRELCLKQGAGMAVAEMVSADLRLKDTEKSRLRRRRCASERVRSVQIVGSDPHMLAEAARFNEAEGADIIDINMGCPAKKVCRKAAGSALLADETLVEQILSAVVNAVGVPVSLKIRTGIHPSARNGRRIARIAEDCGVALLTVHGRTRADRFNGNAEYDTIADIVQHTQIPVLANGDIDSTDKARSVLAHTGAAGIMIGRAAQGQPWLPGLIARQLSGDVSAGAPPLTEQFKLMMSHLVALHEFYGPVMGVRIARKHIGWFLDSLTIGNSATSECSIGDNSELSAPTPQQVIKRAFNQLAHEEQQRQWLSELAQTLEPMNEAPTLHLGATQRTAA